MSLKALAQSALATIISQQTNSVASVVAGAKTADGILDSTVETASFEDAGEMGEKTGTVRCNADTIGVLTRGQSITVGGTAVFVMSHKVDPAGAIVTIEYTTQRPI